MADVSISAPQRWASSRVAGFRERYAVGPWSPRATQVTVLTFALLIVGLVMSFSASFVDAAVDGDPFGVFRRQALWAVLSVGAFVVAATVHPRFWRRVCWILLLVSLVGLVLVLVPGIGVSRNGSQRWIGLGPMVIQPSEIAKLATLLWLADVLERKRSNWRGLTTDHLLVPAVPVVMVMAGLLLLEPDLGTAIILCSIVALVLVVEGLPLRFLGALGLAGGVSAGLLAVVADYRLARITGWLNPEGDPSGAGYQLIQSLVALGSGGWFGLGLGSSRAKWRFVPNPETDFIFAIIGEELGLIGALVTLALFAGILVVGLRIARGAPDGFSRTVAFVITGWLVGQALVNVGTVSGLLPITGVTLPLVSVGGSSLLSSMAALGILVAIGRSGSEIEQPEADVVLSEDERVPVS